MPLTKNQIIKHKDNTDYKVLAIADGAYLLDPLIKETAQRRLFTTWFTDQEIEDNFEVEHKFDPDCHHCIQEGMKKYILPTQEESWEDKWARELGMCCAGCDCGHCNFRRGLIVGILASSKKKWVAEMREKVEGMKKLTGEIGDKNKETYVKIAYNLALSDIINLLEKE